MSKPVTVNPTQTTTHQAATATLAPQVTSQLTPTVDAAYDSANQIQWLLARGIVNNDDVRAYKGV